MQIADISLVNASAVAKTFVPTVKDGLLATYVNREGSRPAVYPNVSVGMRAPKAGVSRKATLKVALPYDVTAGSTTTTESATVFIDVVIPESAAAANVQDILAFASGLLVNAQIKDVCVNGAFPY